MKEEVYRVAKRYGIGVTLVANSRMVTPDDDAIEFVVVGDGFDAADDWIVERAGAGDIVVTTDIPLAARCLENGARVLGPTGRVFSDDSIGEALASREVSAQLREHGLVSGGPAPFGPKDRSQFLQTLDNAIQACRRGM